MYEDSRRFKQPQTDSKGYAIFQNLGLIGLKVCHGSLIAMDLIEEAEKVAKMAIVDYSTTEPLFLTDQEVEDFQSRLPFYTAAQESRIENVLCNVASDVDEYQKLAIWNNNASQQVKSLKGVEEYPCFVFHRVW
jgi:hypothetical protein